MNGKKISSFNASDILLMFIKGFEPYHDMTHWTGHGAERKS